MKQEMCLLVVHTMYLESLHGVCACTFLSYSRMYLRLPSRIFRLQIDLFLRLHLPEGLPAVRGHPPPDTVIDSETVGQPDKRLSINPQQNTKQSTWPHSLPVEHGKCPPTDLMNKSTQDNGVSPLSFAQNYLHAQKALCSPAVHVEAAVAISQLHQSPRACILPHNIHMGKALAPMFTLCLSANT